MSGTGSADGTLMVNLIEPGDSADLYQRTVRQRMADSIAVQLKITCQWSSWGEAIDPAKVAEAAAKDKFKLIGIVHCGASTGVKQP